MKSLIAVLALSATVGAGYWKMQNPDGGVVEAKAQANQVATRLKSGVQAGVEAVRSGGEDSTEALANELQEKLSLQANDTETRLSALQQATTESENKVSGQLQALSTSLTQTVSQSNDQTSSELARLNDTVNSNNRSHAEALADLQSDSDERITELESQIAELTERNSATMDSTIGSLRDNVNQEIENLKAGNQNASVALDSFTEKLASLDTRLDTLSSAAVSAAPAENGDAENNGSIDETIAADLQAGLAAVTAKVDNRLAAMEDRLAAATDADLQSSVTELGTAVTDSQSTAKRLETVIGQNRSRNMEQLGKTQSDLKGMRSEIASLQSQLEESQTTIEQLQAQIENVVSSIESNAVNDSQNGLREQLAELEALVKTTSSTVAAGDAAGANSDAVNAALEQTRDRIRTLEQRVTSLPASSDSASAKQLQDELNVQIAALEQKLLDTASKPDEQIVSTLTEVQQKIAELANREYVTAEELEKLSETKSIQYKIYFRSGSIEISEAAQKVLDSFIAQEANRATGVSVFGTTDRSGSSEFNQQLALRRANSVRSYLIQRGFDFTKIRDVDGIGEDLAAQVLPDGGNDPNQRTVILFAFQP